MFDETPEIANWNSLNLRKKSTRHNLVYFSGNIYWEISSACYFRSKLSKLRSHFSLKNHFAPFMLIKIGPKATHGGKKEIEVAHCNFFQFFAVIWLNQMMPRLLNMTNWVWNVRTWDWLLCWYCGCFVTVMRLIVICSKKCNIDINFLKFSRYKACKIEFYKFIEEIFR